MSTCTASGPMGRRDEAPAASRLMSSMSSPGSYSSARICHPSLTPLAESLQDGPQLQAGLGEPIPGFAVDHLPGHQARALELLAPRRRERGRHPGTPRAIALKRSLPHMSSRMTSSVQRSASTSAARATGQY